MAASLSSPALALQARLARSAVLVVGAGGLGSSAALYLAAAGLARLGLVDHDAVELGNLHRQVIHREASIGRHKALSAADACAALNSGLVVEPHTAGFTADNALALVARYDVVVDASDNAPTRYLISDACVVAGKPLVSAAALGTEGQLTVYHHGPDGPCYRCLFPEAPRAAACARCADAGVLGVVPGIMGTLQALQAIKLAAGVGEVASRRLLLLDALALRFTSVRLRPRSASCLACGDRPAITAANLAAYDYLAFTGQAACDSAGPQLALLPPEQRVTAAQLQQRLLAGGAAGGGARHVLLDVRPREQFRIARLPGAVNVPFEELPQRLPDLLAHCRSAGSSAASGSCPAPPAQAVPAHAPAELAALRAAEHCGMAAVPASSATVDPDACAPEAGTVSADGSGAGSDQAAQPAVTVVCRRGNDSQEVVQMLRAAGVRQAVDLTGGLIAWSRLVDPSFPQY